MKQLADNLDLKILEKLDEDIRIPAQQIADELDVKRQVVDYRIKKMESNGVIINYSILANLSKLGFIYHRVHIKLRSITTYKKEEMFTCLVTHKKTVWIVECDGIYDMMVGFVAFSTIEFRATLFQFLSKYGDYVDYYDIARLVEIVVPGRDFSGSGRLRKIKGNITDNSAPVVMSVISKKIFNQLATNGRHSVIEIAKKIYEPVEKVHYHLKQIIDKKLFISNIQFGYQFFGFELYKTLLYVKHPIPSRVEELKRFARRFPRVWDVCEAQGKWQFELDIESKGHEDYYHIMDAIQDKFSDILENYQTLYARKERKFLFAVFD